jgi:hypothetical protein
MNNVFWDVALCGSRTTNVSEKHVASIFTEKEIYDSDVCYVIPFYLQSVSL